MTSTPHEPVDTVRALTHSDSSVRLRAVLDIGTIADVAHLDILIERAGTEPDFYVRDMLTWSLCRLPADATVPRLLEVLDRDSTPRARSQALHTLSKIGDERAWPAVASMLHDPDDDVACSAWRAATVVVPSGHEELLASELVRELARGDRALRLSVSRALAGLGDAAAAVLRTAMGHPDPQVRAHARATDRLRLDPESSFELSVQEAQRVAALGPDGST